MYVHWLLVCLKKYVPGLIQGYVVQKRGPAHGTMAHCWLQWKCRHWKPQSRLAEKSPLQQPPLAQS